MRWTVAQSVRLFWRRGSVALAMLIVATLILAPLPALAEDQTLELPQASPSTVPDSAPTAAPQAAPSPAAAQVHNSDPPPAPAPGFESLDDYLAQNNGGSNAPPSQSGAPPRHESPSQQFTNLVAAGLMIGVAALEIYSARHHR